MGGGGIGGAMGAMALWMREKVGGRWEVEEGWKVSKVTGVAYAGEDVEDEETEVDAEVNTDKGM